MTLLHLVRLNQEGRIKSWIYEKTATDTLVDQHAVSKFYEAFSLWNKTFKFIDPYFATQKAQQQQQQQPPNSTDLKKMFIPKKNRNIAAKTASTRAAVHHMRWVSQSILKLRLKGSLDLAKFDQKNGSGRWCFWVGWWTNKSWVVWVTQ